MGARTSNRSNPFLKAGKPVFIDKPMAGSLADIIEIFASPKKPKFPCFQFLRASFLQRHPGRP